MKKVKRITDKMRLDWLESQEHLTSIFACVRGWNFHRRMGGNIYVRPNKLREAIDAAIRKENG